VIDCSERREPPLRRSGGPRSTIAGLGPSCRAFRWNAVARPVERPMPLARYFFSVGRSVARAAAHCGCLSAEIAGYRQGKSRFARYPHPFRSEMAGARCLQYQPPDDHSRAHREHRQPTGSANGRRRPGEGAGGICTAAAIRCQSVAAIRSKKAGTDTATQTQDREATRAAAHNPAGAATPIWFRWGKHLVSSAHTKC
jgi:hypothetical protein